MNKWKTESIFNEKNNLNILEESLKNAVKAYADSIGYSIKKEKTNMHKKG